MSLVERGEELSDFSGIFADVTRGKGRIIVVTGVVASGKTELIDTLLEKAGEADADRVVVSSSELTSNLPLALVVQFLQCLKLPPDLRREASALFTESMLSPAPGGLDDGVPETSIARYAHLLNEVVLTAARRRPQIVVVDDVHNADAASLRCLAHLARAIATAPVLLMITSRTGARLAHQFFFDDVLRQPMSTHLRLTPLSQEGTRQLLAARLGEQAATRLSGNCHALTGGNPLLLNAVVEDHLAEALTQVPQPRQQTYQVVVGPRFIEAFLTCLHRVTPEALQLARAVAVLGEWAKPTLLASLTGLDTATTALAFRSLNESGLLRDGQFRHATARATVLGHLGAKDGTALHLKAAAAIYHEGGSVTVIAEHLAAADTCEYAWGVPVLQCAAEHANAADDTATAVRYLRLAYRETANEQLRASIGNRLAALEWRLDTCTVTQHLPTLTTAVRNGHLPHHQLPDILQYLLWHNEVDDARALIAQLPPDVADSDVRTIAALHFLRWWLTHTYPELVGEVRDVHFDPSKHDTTAVSEVVRAQARAATLLQTLLTRGPAHSVQHQAERILQSCQLGDGTLEPLQVSLLALTYLDQLPAAASWCEALYRDSGDRGAPTWRAMLASTYAEIAIRSGDMAAAASYARCALGASPSQTWGSHIGVPLGNLVYALTVMGEHDEAAALLRLPLPEAVLESRYGLHYLRARGTVHLNQDRPLAALSDFLACGKLMLKWGIDLPAILPWRTDAAEAHLQLGNHKAARLLVHEQLHLAQGRTRARAIALRLLARLSAPEDRPRLLTEAVEILHDCKAELELALALTDLASAYQTLGEPSKARMTTRRARRLATRCKAESLRKLLHVGGDVEGADLPEADVELPVAADCAQLSEAERRVADLVCDGNTNREIALKLFVTVSTVEQHLTRIYRKLKVKRRADLATALQMQLLDSSM
ncbi:helix-turn-helix transcriptional regulator [Lentzea sp.]|uniref:helix-turn-helix transcriptional regulator n=1 Tax=Lentzea sp. TaxID=56099 RepID=UPI002ED2D590